MTQANDSNWNHNKFPFLALEVQMSFFAIFYLIYFFCYAVRLD